MQLVSGETNNTSLYLVVGLCIHASESFVYLVLLNNYDILYYIPMLIYSISREFSKKHFETRMSKWSTPNVQDSIDLSNIIGVTSHF